MVERLEEDHRRARILAERLTGINGIEFSIGLPATNMVFPFLADSVTLTPSEVSDKLKAKGIKVGVVGPRSFRLVTHYWITDEDLDLTVRAFQTILQRA
jgi:threonine aldolase